MAYWLVKSEPETWSWEDQVEKGVTHWDGVRNYQAANNMKAMKNGEQAFFYHSGKEKSVVGIVTVVREYYPDPSDKTGTFGMVDFKAVKGLKKPLALGEIKSHPILKNMVLARQSRLSVSPVTAQEWAEICRLGGL